MDHHFTAEEMAAASGIEDETFPEMGFTESPSQSYSSPISPRSSPRPQKSEEQEVKRPHTASVFPEQVTRVYDRPLNGSVKSDLCPEASHPVIWTLSGLESLKSKPSPDRELRTAEVNESRNVPLTYPIPDFSKVKPRVRLPIGDYRPPASRPSSIRESLSSHIMFMSTADIVREVLLNTTEGSIDPSAPSSSVPQDFRCRQEAITLVEQLQEDHNRLLTKHAEANNTIDRLRLKAKVDLYSEPPQPGHSVQSGLSNNSSKVMTLDFPRAQRAEINSGSLHSDGHSAPPSPYVGEQLAEILHTQSDKFLQQLQIYEDLLRRKQLKPSEQIRGLAQLNKGLDSLERGFLFAREEHKLLQQRGEDVGPFDQERELGGLIFQCGMRMDELKEQAEQMRQDQPTCEAPPSPPPHPTPPSAPSEDGRWSLPQSPHMPLLVGPESAAELEASPASGEGDDEETDDEGTLKCQYLKPLTGKHRRAQQDFAALTDHYGSFKELPRTFEYNLREAAFFSGALGSHERPGVDETERQRIGDMDEQRIPEPHSEESPAGSRKQRSRRSCPSSHAATSPPASLPVHPRAGPRRAARERVHSSSLSSLGETPASERRNSKLQPGSSRTLNQPDGVISPETDSGFIGSETCHLTPPAGPSPLHQGASQSYLVHQDGNTRTPQTISASSPPSSPIRRHTAAESRGASWALSPEPTSRARQRRRDYSCSPQGWVGQTERTRADRGARLESDSTHTVSEDGQSDQFAGSLSFQPSSSPTSPRHHGNSLRALGPRVVADRNALRTLEAQVIRLEEIMHHLLNKTTLSSVRAGPSALENHTHLYTSTPRSRPEERCQNNVRKGRRERQKAEDVEECILRPTAIERSPCVDWRPPQIDICTGSDPEPFTSQPRPRISRCTQTSSAAPGSCCSITNTVQSNETHPRQLPAESIQESNTADEPDLRNPPPPVLCVKCLSRLRGQSARPTGGSSESTPTPSSCSHHCPLCGCLQPNRDTKTDCHRDAAPRSSYQSAKSPDRTARRGYHAAPPTPPQCMLVGPPLLLYSQPVHVSPSKNPGTSSGVRGHKESRGRMRRSRSVDGQISLDVSLDRAIRAAQHMRLTSRHMACSLATGLQFQERLTQFSRR
ncbi:microtubule organization protein AKNA-like [Platichthys flesus]|uniref:microtubule organization protein AKNA-like n=1 Tax=Platichthys flesus TaxID=8260 RepID=UPI002DBBDBC3|nr:microtubule organization protein AKNA-like [Platichthys flesus]